MSDKRPLLILATWAGASTVAFLAVLFVPSCGDETAGELPPATCEIDAGELCRLACACGACNFAGVPGAPDYVDAAECSGDRAGFCGDSECARALEGDNVCVDTCDGAPRYLNVPAACGGDPEPPWGCL